MKFNRILAALAVAALGTSPQGRAASPSLIPVEEKISSLRSDMNLNGEWNFAPASSRQLPQEGWGSILVPGGWYVVKSWTGVHMMVGGIVKAPAEPVTDDLASGWYARAVEIPKEWAGRAIELELTRVSTDAEVSVNGVRCGEIHWPAGKVDISPGIKFGQTNEIQILVFAVQTEKEVSVYMGSEQNLQWKNKASLDSKGIIGEAFLHSRPRGTFVSDVFVKTSIRKETIGLEVELRGVKQAGDVKFTASMLAPDGHCEKVFEGKSSVQAQDCQVVNLEWHWSHPRLWDVGKPELYTLLLEAEGAGLKDEYAQGFGFREFWIDGRKFYLNGTELRIRPIIAPEVAVAHPAHMDKLIDSMMKAGWNLAEFWPNDILVRGVVQWRSLWYERADQKGFLVTGTLPSVNDIINREEWTDPEKRAAYEQQVALELRKYRNHPSVVLSAISANYLGYNQDPNPWLIGTKFVSTDQQKYRTEQCLEAISFVKAIDPTRGVFSHQGGWAGDIHTLNAYLNMMPLQEREEYVSHYVEAGQMPFMIVEGGTPFVYTFCRARHGFDEGRTSEPLATEYCAIYQGRKSYAVEPDDYRKMIVAKLAKTQPPDAPDISHFVNAHGQIYDIIQGDNISRTPQVQELERLFIQNTWRSWRTMGLSALMIPWSMRELGWDAEGDRRGNVQVPMEPSNRGWSAPTVEAKKLYSYTSEAATLLPAGQAVVSNSQPTLAWICGTHGSGDVADVTSKDHSFFAGREIRKSVALINDGRETKPYTAIWTVEVAGRPIATKTEHGSLKPAEIALLPIRFDAPQKFDGVKADGVITLAATIGGIEMKDAFPFRVFKPASPLVKAATIDDPVGKTSAMLKEVGVKTTAWKPGSNGNLLLVGREYFNTHDQLPAGSQEFVEKGGRLVIFAQDPWRLRNLFNFRIAHQMPRNVFGIDPKHPVMTGLDDVDLCNWSGTSTLAEARTRQEIPYTHTSYHVWKWGNRGGLSSAAIEKPHHSSWRPILECEFDLAYSPLMEMDYGKGRVILCTLDLEDYVSNDPAARQLLANLLDYAKTALIEPKGGKTVYLGGDAGTKFLDSMGLVYEKVQDVPADAKLAVVGPDSPVDLSRFLQKGGKALYLARQEGEPFGVVLKKDNTFHGSLDVPLWPESAGLSPSDLRFRVDQPWLLVASGAETGAGGLLGRIRQGLGTALLCQLDPTALDTETKPYLRFTRWRQTRAIAQLLANMGAKFANDDRLFTLRRDEIYIAGMWDAKVLKVLDPPIIKWADTGERGKELNVTPQELNEDSCMNPDAVLTGWKKAWIPGGFEWMVPNHPGSDGVALFRRVVDIPEEWNGKTLVVDFDKCMNGLGAVCWDGKPMKRIGGPNWDWPVVYQVSPEMATPGRHVLAAQLVNVWYESRLGFNPYNMRITPQDWTSVGWYHPDYRRDREYGDDPYRYVRW